MQRSFHLMFLGFVTAIVGFAHGATAADFPRIVDFGPTNDYGAGVQRSMRLMEDSSATRKQTVKVMFYGQSVTQQGWFWYLGLWLQARYTNANVVFTNLAVGFNSDLLTTIAEADIMSIYPDLIIYQNYGSIHEIESIVARARLRTTADILIQTEHPTLPEHLTEGTNNATAVTTSAIRNYIELPGIAQKYGAELCDVRSPWKSYLIQNNLEPAAVLRDSIHPDYEAGNYLMEEFVKSHLRVDRKFSSGSWRSAVTTLPLPPERWSSITIPFVGNRLDLVISKNGTSPISILIDGKKPSEFPELYAFSRPEFYPGAHFPALLQANSYTPRLAESWKATVIETFYINGYPNIRYSLSGSKTGFDGTARSNEPFISNSRRVVLTPSDWAMIPWAKKWEPVLKPLPPGYEIKWESIFFGKDEIVPAISDPTLETCVTIAQGLANGAHTLTLTGADTSAIEAVRIYNPLARIQPDRPREISIESITLSEGQMRIRKSGEGRYVVENSDDADGPWRPLSAPLKEREFSTAARPDRQFVRLRKID